MIQLPEHFDQYQLVDHRYRDPVDGSLMQWGWSQVARKQLHAQNDAEHPDPPFGNRWRDDDWLAGFVAIEWATAGEPIKLATEGYGSTWQQIAGVLRNAGHKDLVQAIKGQQSKYYEQV